jgi:hypothetical protein
MLKGKKMDLLVAEGPTELGVQTLPAACFPVL